MTLTTELWIGFFVVVLALLLLDLLVFHKHDEAMPVKKALWWSAFWIGLAGVFNIVIWWLLGAQPATEFLTAYLLEKSLSVDNLFVFIMIFGFFNIKAAYQHKILFWGIIGAIIMRALFIFLGVELIKTFSWVMYIFGAFLVYTGGKMFFEHDKEEDFNPNDNFFIKWMKKVIPYTDDMSSHRFFVKQNHKWLATPFFTALVFIELSDLIFAIDSIPAVLSVSQDIFIIYTSNIFAILGLRSLYFALSGIMDMFTYLKYALAGILSFIGVKMIINELAKHQGWDFHISNFVSLGIIVGLITISIIVSIRHNKKQQKLNP